MTIIAQSGEIVNYSHIVSIYPIAVDAEREATGEELTALSLIAQPASSPDSIELGLFESDEDVIAVINELIEHIRNGKPVYEIPVR